MEAYSAVNVRICPKFKLVQDFMHVFKSLKRIEQLSTEKKLICLILDAKWQLPLQTMVALRERLRTHKLFTKDHNI